MLPIADDNPTRRRAWVTLLLIVVNIGVYVFVQPPNSTGRFEYEHAAIPCEVTTGEPLAVDEIATALRTGVDRCEEDSAFPPAFPRKQVYLAVLVSMFLHGGVLHVAGNMLFLWIFGNNVEDRLGPMAYILFYVVAGVAATLAHVVLQPESTIPLVGASGAIAGVMGAYLVWFPNARVRSLVFLGFFAFFPEIPAKWVLLFWFVSQFFLNPNEGVAWAAHVGGFVFGVLLGFLLRPRQPRPAISC